MSNIIPAGQGAPQPSAPKVSSGLNPNREATVAQQIGNVIGAINTFTMTLCATRESDGDSSALSDRMRVVVEGGLQAAVCRMAAIMNDDARWSNQGYDDLAGRLRALYEKQNELFDIQRELAEENLAPHSRLQPRILKLPSGGWTVYVGNPQLPDGLLYGHGMTLKEAIQNFDQAYHASPEENKQNYEQQQNMDGIGSPTPKRRAGVGEDIKTVGEVSEKDPKSDGHTDLQNPPRRKRASGD